MKLGNLGFYIVLLSYFITKIYRDISLHVHALNTVKLLQIKNTVSVEFSS